MRISSRIGLSLEGVSMAIILFVCLTILTKYGFKLDMKQVTMEGLSPSAIPQAIVFGIFAFVGFESAATLAKETRNPDETIPRAINWTAIAAGLFFVFTTYVITMGFDDDVTKLAASSSPLADILSNESPLLTAFVYFGAAISSFACALGLAQRLRTPAVLARALPVRASIDGHGACRTQDAACRSRGRRGDQLRALRRLRERRGRDRHLRLVWHDGLVRLHPRLSAVLDLRAGLSARSSAKRRPRITPSALSALC